MSSRSKILIASLIALVAGFAAAQLAPSAQGVVDKYLQWKNDGQTVRLTITSPDHAYLVYVTKEGAPPAKLSAGAKQMVQHKLSAGSAAFGTSSRIIVMAPVLICGPACRPCSETADCPLPPPPPPVSETWITGR